MDKTIRQKRSSVFIETYGCQMNKSDSEVVAGLLAASGYDVVENQEEADVILINTCSVRNHAEKRALGRISVLASWRREVDSRKLGIIGCMAQRMGNDLLTEKPFVDFIVGPDEYRSIPRLIGNGHDTRRALTQFHDDENYSGIIPYRESSICGWITITRGCNNFCSYCIVPYTRGRERSRPAEDILRETEHMVHDGIVEVTLLGQNVNSYDDGKNRFSDLLRMISRVSGIHRIRFLTSHPKDLTDDILEVIASEDEVCPHIHLPVQSGSNHILSLMNRHYTRERYLGLVEKARDNIPDVSITSDILVGFPGETESDFSLTYALMEEVRFDEAFTYRYSTRQGTRAAEMEDNLTEKERLDRLDKIIRLQRGITREKKIEMIGRFVEVLPEAENKQSPEEWMGRTGMNHVVVFPKDGISLGQPVMVRITECRGSTLRGITE
jgi:tRNA-2-methylthio-N6-dimethylallyladenosine synthase